MASAAVARRKIARLKAEAEAARQRVRTQSETVATAPATNVSTDPPSHSQSTHGQEKRLASFASKQRPFHRGASPSTFEAARAAPATVEQNFQAAQEGKPEQPSMRHLVWSGALYVGLLVLATQAADALPEDATTMASWQSFGLWRLFVVAAVSVLLLTWRNIALPAMVFAFAFFLIAWRAPFLEMGVFADANHWTAAAVPWWTLLTITCLTKALETRGERRRYQLRALMVLQGMQIATYAGLVLLSIFFLGRTGTIETKWAVTIIALLAGWFLQGRSLLTMWNRLEGRRLSARTRQVPLWTEPLEQTGK